MKKHLKDIFLILFTAAYFAASQITVLSIISAWYSTTDNSAVAMHKGMTRDLGLPSWTPRTQLIVAQHPELSQSVPTSPFLYPVDRAYRVLQLKDAVECPVASYYSELCNKAPPRV